MRHSIGLAALVVAAVMWQPAMAADEKIDVGVKAAAKPAAAETDRPFALPAGIAAKDLKEAGDIRNAFGAVTEEAFDTDDAFDNIVNRLVDADRNRIAKWRETKPNFAPLHARTAELNRLWKAKYGKEFDVDEKVIFGEGGHVAMLTGEVADPTQLVGKWPVAPVGPEAMTAAGKEPAKAAPADTAQQTRDAGKVGGGDVNLEKGRNVAIARFPASHGMPAIDSSLIHELPDIWRFDIPDNIDGQKLHDNLLAHLNQLGDGSHWPADIKEAYRIVGHHVLMALYDVQMPQKAVDVKKASD